MKLAPVHRVLTRQQRHEHVIVHTGQHYDSGMSDTFFVDLQIPEPDYNLDVGSDTHARQTAEIMKRVEPVLLDERPDLVLVYGDVNSTVAAALVAVKLGIKVGHVEAGLRSRDWSMPEEINRVVTDRLSDLLFTPSQDADANLVAEGVQPQRVHFVGNVMIDTLTQALPMARQRASLGTWNVRERAYVVATLHRPSNVDDRHNLGALIGALRDMSREWPVIFPVHPRTRQRLEEFGFSPPREGPLQLVAPVGYVEMLGLVDRAGLVLTDSGGLQEETTFLGVPCLTVRPNTERPVTILEGTNELVPSERDAVLRAAERNFGMIRDDCRIEFWDGRAAERLAKAIEAL
jgi:UDP-N-acetylglucosamine 2-epimerase (non-hydrolysing)